MSLELVCSLFHGTQPLQEDAMGHINQESNLYVSWFGMLEYSCLCGNMFFNASLNLLLEKWKCMCLTRLCGWLVDQNRSFLAFFSHSFFHGHHYPLLKNCSENNVWSFFPKLIWVCLYNLHRAVSFWTCDKKLIGLQIF